MVEVITEVALNKLCSGTKRKMTGQMKIKNNSSRKRLQIMITVLRPTLIPSLFRNKITKLEPPTAEGVTAEVNSFKTCILKALLHDNSLFAIKRNRHIIPKSRPNININASNIKPTLFRLNEIPLKKFRLNSDRNNQPITIIPIATGIRICESLNGLKFFFGTVSVSDLIFFSLNDDIYPILHQLHFPKSG